MPFSVKILRFFGILLLSLCALGVAGMTWAYLIEPNLLFVRKVDYRVPQWKGKGTPVKVVIAGDLHLMPTAFDEVRALRYVQRIMRLRPDLILLVGDYARGSSENASMDPATAARLLKGLTAPCGVFAIQGNHDFTFGWGQAHSPSASTARRKSICWNCIDPFLPLKIQSLPSRCPPPPLHAGGNP